MVVEDAKGGERSIELSVKAWCGQLEIKQVCVFV